MSKNIVKRNFSLFIIPLTSFTFGLSLTTFEILKKEYMQIMTENDWSLVVSIFCLGALISNLTIHMAHLSLKYKLIVGQTCFLIGNLLFFIKNFWVVLIGRIFIGLGSGVVCAVVPIFLNLLAPFNISGIIGSFHQLGIVTGVLCGQVMSYIFDDKDVKISMYIIIAFLGALLTNLIFIQNAEMQ